MFVQDWYVHVGMSTMATTVIDLRPYRSKWFLKGVIFVEFANFLRFMKINLIWYKM